MQNVNAQCIAAQSPQDTHATYGVVQRTETDRMANGIRLGGGRNLIGRRTETGRGCRPQMHQPSKQGYIPTEYAEPSDRDVPPTDRHRCTQIRRVWHPAIPTQPTKGVQLSQLHQQSKQRVFPQNTQNTQNRLAEKAAHR